MATRRPSKNSGRLILDNCYHGHGLCGARLQITATSCLHPYTTVTALLVRYFLKGFPCCPYPRRRAPLSLVRNCVCRNAAEYIKLPFLLEAGKFMASLCSGSGKYCFFQSNVLAAGKEGVKPRSLYLPRNLKNCLQAKRVLPLYRGRERVIITEIQWTPRNCRPFFSCQPAPKEYRLLLFREKKKRRGWTPDSFTRKLVFPKNSSRVPKLPKRIVNMRLCGKHLYPRVNDGQIYEKCWG